MKAWQLWVSLVAGTIALGATLVALPVRPVVKLELDSHLVDYEAVRAEVLYDKCVRECREVCQSNGVPAAQCRCTHCRRLLRE